MKNVLEIINLPSSAINFIGGQFKYLHEVGGYRMHLICSPGDEIREFCEENEVCYFPVQLNRQIALMQDVKSLISICKYIHREHIDVVIAHQPKGRLLGMLACMIMRVRYRIIFSHGILYETMSGPKRKLIMLYEKFVSIIAERIVCVSKYVQERRLEDHIDNPSKQLILGCGSCNGIDTINKFNPKKVTAQEILLLKEKLGIYNNDFVIGFCGRLVKDKGVVELIEAFKQITSENDNKSIKLLIIGPLEERDSLPLETIECMTSHPNIIFAGPIPYEIIQQYYLLMNVLVLPTHREGFGMVAIEASAMERPVVVSSYTGCAETIIEGETGLYIDKSPESIKSAIEKCFDNDYSRKLGTNGRIFIQTNFEHTQVRRYMLDFLNSYCKEKSSASILLLGSGTQALAILKSLSKYGYRVLCLDSDYGNYADVSRYVARRFLCELPIDSADFLSYVEQLVKKEGVDVILPMGDVYAEFLSKNKTALEPYAKFTVPDYFSFLRGYDKNKLMSLCEEKGYPHPLTIDLSTICNLEDEAIKEFPYPAMLKPNCTTGGRGMILVKNYDEFRCRYPALHSEYGEYHLQRYIRKGGRQVKIQMCVDSEGSLICHSALHKVRWYPVKGGASSCSVSIEEKEMTRICHQILKDIGWKGFADFDLIEDPDSRQLLIMEINPRLPACVGAAVHAGVEWGLIMVDQALGHSQKSYTYKKGVTLRHLGFDMLWFFKSTQRFHTVPSWFYFWGKDIYYQDINGWGDPIPFISGTYHNIKKLINPNFRKSKQL